MAMQDPSYGVAPQLQNHVHLISAYPFPLMAQLPAEQAVRYLLESPVVVKQTAPMSWTYVNAPQDGTIWLEWLSPTRANNWASDGYVWGDSEITQRLDFQGYTIEIFRHTLGFRPGQDQIASHARTRYHIIHKAAHVPAAQPDPSLWIVHYHQAQQMHMLPVQQIQILPLVGRIMQERQLLQNQGRLEKRDFMLHDREHWPHINGPTGAQLGHNMMQPGFYGSNPVSVTQGRYGQAAYPPGYGQQPPAKRQRTSTLPGAIEGVPDTSIEDEENTALGDYFDHLTPRDISMARYQQHHRWMEEVYSSPYATGQIQPADLGLGLMGELKHLTEGLVEPPSVDPLQQEDSTAEPKEAPAFTNLSNEQVEEFRKRVERHLEDGQAEIERMKAEHAERMQSWKKSKSLLAAEKRLRYASWEGHEPAVKLYEPASDGQAPLESKETVEDIVKEVEGLLDVKFVERKAVTLVEKGGLEREKTPPLQKNSARQYETQPNSDSMDFQPDTFTAPMPSTHQQLPAYNQHQVPFNEASAPQSAPTLMPQQPPPQPNSSYAQPTPLQANPQNNNNNNNNIGLQRPTAALDVDSMQFQSGTAVLGTTSTAPSVSAPTAASIAQQYNRPAQSTLSNDPSPLPSFDTTATLGPAPADDTLFADTFNDFGDDNAGDELIDFGAGDGLEESAFGEALHGMETGDGDGDGEGEMFGTGNAEAA